MKKPEHPPERIVFENTFCPKCERHNKLFPDNPRETFFDGLVCPQCNPIKRRKVIEVIKEIEEKYPELR